MQEEALKIFEETQAIVTNIHVVYTSGYHGSSYINKDAIYPHTEKISKLCEFIAESFKDYKIDGVIGPVIGGIVLAQWTAHHLSKIQGKEIVALCADKVQQGSETEFVIKRGQEKFIRNKKILVVEDNITTGGSVRKVIKAVQELEGEIVGVGALCNRGGITAEQLGNIPIAKSLLEIPMDAFNKEQCPLCKQGIPINTQLGKG